VDAGAYARELMQHAEVVSYGKAHEGDPRKLLMEAFQRMNKNTLGSCTACILIFEGDQLRCANLGDSGVLAHRHGEKVPFFRSSEQQHHWNCPFQLGHDSGDEPIDSEVKATTVQCGDIFVVGTDGLFDNLFDHTILALIDRFVHEQQAQDGMRAGWPITDRTSGRAPAASVTARDIAESITSSRSKQHVRAASNAAASIHTSSADSATVAAAANAAAPAPNPSVSSDSSSSSPSPSPSTPSSATSDSVSSSDSASPSPSRPSPFPNLTRSQLDSLARHLVDQALLLHVTAMLTRHSPSMRGSIRECSEGESWMILRQSWHKCKQMRI